MGQVGTICTGTDGALQVRPQRLMVLADAGNCLADCAGCAGSSAFRGGTRTPIASPQPDCPGQFADQKVTFGLSLCGPLVIPHGPRLLYVLLDIGKMATVRLLGLRIKQHPGVQARRESQAALCAAACINGLASAAGH